MSELGFNVLWRRDLDLKSHPKDRRSGVSILRSLDWQFSVLPTTLLPLLRLRRSQFLKEEFAAVGANSLLSE